MVRNLWAASKIGTPALGESYQVETLEHDLKEGIVGQGRKKPSRIAVLGVFGQQNLGNESTLDVFLRSCRKYLPEAEIKCICSVPEDTAARHKISTFPMFTGNSPVWSRFKNPVLKLGRKIFIYLPREVKHWFKGYRTLANIETLFVTGTGLLTDAYQTSLGFPYTVFKWSVLATIRRCRLVYVSIGAGPIDRPLSRWFIKSALSRAVFRSYRDPWTREYLIAMGFPAENDPVYPDLVFNMPLPESICCGNGKKSRRRVAIGIMSYLGKPNTDKRDYGFDEKYLERVVAFAVWLVANQYDVRILYGDMRYDPPALEYTRHLLTATLSSADRCRVIDEPVSSTQELLTELAATDVVVATRFHNLLLALMLNKPAISISFHQKCASLMSLMGLSKYCLDIRDLDVNQLIERFCDLEKNAQALSLLIAARTEELRRALDEQDSIIFQTPLRG